MESYTRGPQLPLIEDPIYDVLIRTAQRCANRPALVSRHQGIRLTWSELAAETERIARGLAGLGLLPGDRVGVWATNCAEWILLQLACARAGYVLVNVNPAYRAHELRFVLKKSGMKVLVLRHGDQRTDYNRILEEARTGLDLPLRHVIFLEDPSWTAMLANGRDPGAGPASPHDVTNIQYTSGTTGSPKGVLLTHHNLINNAAITAGGLKITEQDKVIIPVPLYHCFGCVIGVLLCVATGATMVLPSPQFDALATLEAIHHERGTVIYGVPTMFIAELSHPEFAKFDLTSLRTGIMAGAPCPIEIMRRVVNEMHCPEMTIVYGQTESSPCITYSTVDDDLETRVTTVGRAMPNTEVKIIGPDGTIVPAGIQGELCTRGYLVMKGYDQEPEATARAIDHEGWLHTGDLATMRPDGYYKITGRAKDMIIRGGENIYPREVEEFLYTHPKVADVQVVGLPDIKLGEAVLAWVKPKPGTSLDEEELRQWCQGRIAHFKIPQYWRFVDEFPLTVTGKIQKFRIRQMEIEARGLQSAASIQTA